MEPDKQYGELVAFLGGKPEFEEYDIEEDGSIWARFVDGRLHIIDPLFKRPAGIPPAAHSPSGAIGGSSSPALAPGGGSSVTSGLPESKNVFVFNAVGGNFVNPRQDISKMLTDNGYIDKGNDSMTVDDLKLVTAAGVLYINSHGCLFRTKKNGPVYFAVSTTTEVNMIQDIDRADDLKDPNPPLIPSPGFIPVPHLTTMSILWTRNPDGSPVYKTIYAVTETFVRDYMNFGNNGFAFIDGCNSQNKSGFAKAFTDKKVVYAGWINPVDNLCAGRRSLFLFDRLLGSNSSSLPKENPLQRPFDYPSVFDYMSHRADATGTKWNQCNGLDYNPLTAQLPPPLATLTFTAPAGNRSANFQMLVPSIESIWVDEVKNILELYGTFGDDRRSVASVIICENEDDKDGVTCDFVDWLHDIDKGPDTDLVRCKINRDGAGSAGYVRLTIDSRASNAVPLTKWKGTLTYTMTDKGQLKAQAAIGMLFRGDTHEFRVEPGQPTFKGCHATIVCRDFPEAKGHWQASGSYKRESDTITWSGEGDLEPLSLTNLTASSAFTFGLGPSPVQKLDAVLSNSIDHKGVFSFASTPGIHWEIIDDKDGHKETGDEGFSENISKALKADYLTLTMNTGDYSFDQGKVGPVTLTSGDGPPPGPPSAMLEWTKMEVLYPPTKKTKS